MARILAFTIAQSADCNTLTFTETTGNGTDGYSGPGNVAFSAIKNTFLLITFPDATNAIINKGYLPTQDASPNGTQNYTAADFGYTNIPNGVWNVEYRSYSTDTVSGSLVAGTEYIVTGTGSSITYEGITYIENQIFTAGAVPTYTENATSEVNVFYSSINCNVLLYCGLKECLKDLMLTRCNEDCGCSDEFHDSMNELIVDFNTASLAFTAQNYDCANKTIQRLESKCGGICNDC